MFNTLIQQLAVISFDLFFHRVDWNFTFSAFHMFGYGNKSIHMVPVGYTNIQSKTKINDLLSNPFTLMGEDWGGRGWGLGSFRRAAPFVEHFMVLYNKIIFNQGAMY